MASVTSQLIEEVTAHAQSDSLEDAREICADGTYFPNNLRNIAATSYNRCCSGKAIGITYPECVSSLSYPACNAHEPYCHLGPVRIYSVFP